MTPTDTLREAVQIAINQAIDTHGEFATGAMTDAALSAIEAAGWRVVPVEPDADQIRAGLDDLGWWSEPQPEAREGGAIVDPGLSAEDSAFFNKQMMDTVASAYAAMLSAAPRLDATVRGEEG